MVRLGDIEMERRDKRITSDLPLGAGIQTDVQLRGLSQLVVSVMALASVELVTSLLHICGSTSTCIDGMDEISGWSLLLVR